MSDNRSEHVTALLGPMDGTDPGTVATMAPAVYRELRRLAERYMQGERSDHTLQATGLVHEAYVRLAEDATALAINNRQHFLRIAARTMRRILVNHAHAHHAQKRGGDRQRVSLDTVERAFNRSSPDLVALDETLDRLGRQDPRLATIVELRFFGGCTNDEVAEALDVSTRTIEREWRTARAWLRSELDA